MINTVHIKNDQFKVFRTGNSESKEVILIMGSCRGVPYLNYLDYYNKKIGNNKYLIYYIDPFNYNWDEKDVLVGCENKLIELETDANMLSILSSVKIFIHEHYESFGMFNTNKEFEKTIYQFGMNPEIDITLPNFHDVFILTQDYYKLDAEFAKRCILVRGELTPEMKDELKDKTITNLKRFYKVCSLSSFPKMEKYFNDYLQSIRFFWSFNHVSKHYTLKVFEWMNQGYLYFNLTPEFWNEISKHDLYENNPTPLTNYDIELYGLKWNEQVHDFKTINKL